MEESSAVLPRWLCLDRAAFRWMAGHGGACFYIENFWYWRLTTTASIVQGTQLIEEFGEKISPKNRWFPAPLQRKTWPIYHYSPNSQMPLGFSIFAASDDCHGCRAPLAAWDLPRKLPWRWSKRRRSMVVFLDTPYITIQDGKHSTTNLEDVDFENVGQNWRKKYKVKKRQKETVDGPKSLF